MAEKIHVSIQSQGPIAIIKINGQLFSSGCEGYTIRQNPGENAILTISLVCDSINYEGEDILKVLSESV